MGHVGTGLGTWDSWDWDRGVFRLGGTGLGWDRGVFRLGKTRWDWDRGIFLGCNNRGGGGNFSKVNPLVAKRIGTQKRL